MNDNAIKLRGKPAVSVSILRNVFPHENLMGHWDAVQGVDAIQLYTEEHAESGQATRPTFSILTRSANTACVTLTATTSTIYSSPQARRGGFQVLVNIPGHTSTLHQSEKKTSSSAISMMTTAATCLLKAAAAVDG